MPLRFITAGDARITTNSTDSRAKRMKNLIQFCNNIHSSNPTKLDFLSFMGDNVDNNQSGQYDVFKNILSKLNPDIGKNIAPIIKDTQSHAFIVQGNHDGSSSTDLSITGNFYKKFGFLPEQKYLFIKDLVNYQTVIPALLNWPPGTVKFNWASADTTRRTIVFHHGPAMYPCSSIFKSPFTSNCVNLISDPCKDSSIWNNSSYKYAFNSQNHIYTHLVDLQIKVYVCGHVHIHDAQKVDITDHGKKRRILHAVEDSFVVSRCPNNDAQRKVGYVRIDDNGTTRYKLIRFENPDGTVAPFIDPFPT